MTEDEAMADLLDRVLYGYILHRNYLSKLWFAIPRDEYVDYWNGTSANCLAHEDEDELKLAVLHKYLEDNDLSDN